MYTVTIEVFHASEVEENLHDGFYWRIARDDTSRPSAAVGPFDTDQQAKDNARGF